MNYMLDDQVISNKDLKAGDKEVRKNTLGKVVDFGARSGDPIVEFTNGVIFVCHPTYEVTLLS
jgi:hypothetical protein